MSRERRQRESRRKARHGDGADRRGGRTGGEADGSGVDASGRADAAGGREDPGREERGSLDRDDQPSLEREQAELEGAELEGGRDELSRVNGGGDIDGSSESDGTTDTGVADSNGADDDGFGGERERDPELVGAGRVDARGRAAAGRERQGADGGDAIRPEELERVPAVREAREPARKPAGQPAGGKAVAFLRASWAELQRVQWPDRPEVSQATAVVLGFVIVAGVYLGVADWVAQKIINLIL